MDNDYTNSLYPDVMCEILKRIPLIDRLCSVPLVSTRMCQACRDPALWTSLRVVNRRFSTGDVWLNFLTWITTRASGLRTFHLDDTEDERFQSLSGDTCRERVKDIVQVLAAHATQLRDLILLYPTSLDTYEGTIPLYYKVADLRSLSNLTSLTLNLESASLEAASLSTALQGLRSLQHLSITSISCDWRECLVTIAGSSTQLTCLQIGSGSFARGVLDIPLDAPEEIGHLVNLVSLRFDHVHLCSLPEEIAMLSSLKELFISDHYHEERISVQLPWGLTQCGKLSRLFITTDRGCTVLPHLTCLSNLSISLCVEMPHNESNWPRHIGLTELELGVLEAPNDGVLHQVVSLTGLKKLGLSVMEWDNLQVPEGRYLVGLESIVLVGFTFRGMYALKACEKLRQAEFWGTHKLFNHPKAFFAMLRSFEALETVMLTSAETIHSGWDIALNRYKEYCYSRGRNPAAINVIDYVMGIGHRALGNN